MLVRLGKFKTPPARPNTLSGSELLLGGEWNGLAIDFISNTYITSVSSMAEFLISSSSLSQETAGFALDFTDNSSAVRI